MPQRIYRLVKQNLFFSFIPDSIINGTNTAKTLRDALSNTVNGFRDNHILIDKADSVILDGGVEDDTISYVQVVRGNIANLKQDFAFIPAYNTPLKIMPLGDSITSGVMGTNDRNSGGYRTELWKKFVANGLKVDFVGSKSNGPDSLGNKDHEGHPGWEIEEIASSINGWLSTFEPDLVLLMIGTNDTKKKPVRRMIKELSALIDQITTHSPDVQLLVASIPPIHPAKHPARRVQRTFYFNRAIPGIVNSKVAQGKKVYFVDMRSLTVNDLTSSLSLDLDNGLHPNAQGYRKIANLWYDAVLKVTSNRLSTSAFGLHRLAA